MTSKAYAWGSYALLSCPSTCYLVFLVYLSLNLRSEIFQTWHTMCCDLHSYMLRAEALDASMLRTFEFYAILLWNPSFWAGLYCRVLHYVAFQILCVRSITMRTVTGCCLYSVIALLGLSYVLLWCIRLYIVSVVAVDFVEFAPAFSDLALMLFCWLFQNFASHLHQWLLYFVTHHGLFMNPFQKTLIYCTAQSPIALLQRIPMMGQWCAHTVWKVKAVGDAKFAGHCSVASLRDFHLLVGAFLHCCQAV